MGDERHRFDCTKVKSFSRSGNASELIIALAMICDDPARRERWRMTPRTSMAIRQFLIGAVTAGAIVGIAGCGGSSSGSTPTPSTGGLTLPNIPGLNAGSGKSAPAANTLLSASDVQTISGDPNVSALSGGCSSTTTCVYSDASGSGGGGGVIVVEPFPGFVGQAALQAGIAAALSGQASGSGSNATAVSGLGSAAIKEIDTNSATYAFVKDNYLVVLNVTSGSKSGADMDSQVQAAAQRVAGSL